VFHYLCPSLAVLLFVHVGVLGVGWLRIASAAFVFALWRKPWRVIARATRRQRIGLLTLGIVLAGMNFLFYLAVDRLPLATVGAIEFLGVILLAALGMRTKRNMVALLFAIAGVTLLTELHLSGDVLGFVFAFGNCAGFMLYIVLGHRMANSATTTRAPIGAAGFTGIDQLGMSMLIAAIVATPIGLASALTAFRNPLWLLWGVGVGVCSSVIPYVTDQLAMARLSRATFAQMLSILPAAAVVIGLVVLHQVPTIQDLLGIILIIIGVAIHHERIQSQPGDRNDTSAVAPAP
jgi:inner membrane transporter RhtA